MQRLVYGRCYHGSLGGEVDTLLVNCQMLMVEGRKLGLVVDVAQCEVILH